MARAINRELVSDTAMVQGAADLANAVKKFAPHQHIKDSVSIGRTESAGASKFISVTIGSEDARAFDKGSGLHGELGSKYIIRAKNVPYLKFFWVKRNTWFKGKYVWHPGVRGTGYVQEAKDSVRKQIRERIKKDAVGNIRLYLRAELAGK